MNANEQFAAAIRHLQAGRAADAESVCRTILAVAPDHADSLHLLGILAHQADRNAAAVEHLRKAIALNDRVPQCHFNIALAYFALGRLQDAKGHYQRALALNPNYAEAHNNLGSVLLTQGRPDEAIAQFQRSLALKPSLFEAQINFGKALLAKGSMEAALSVLVRALEARDAPETKALIVACLRHMTSLPPGIDADSILVRAISEPWGRPDDLLQVTTGLLKSSPVLGECIARAAKAWPARLPAEDLYARPGLAAVAGSRVLRCLLESVAIADVELERFLTSARSALLQIASSTAASIPEDEHMLGFACSLARQCFINDYVFDLTTDERDHARQLQATIAAALAAGAAIPALRLVAVAAYVPLHAVAQAERLLDMSWPEPVTGVLVQQIREPQDEKRRRGTIAALTEISMS